MAETKKATEKATEKTTAEMVTVVLPRDPNPKHPQQEFFSHNFENYIIKRGVPVEVPKPIADMIQRKYEAENLAFEYSESRKLREEK